MAPIKLRMRSRELNRIRELVKYEEARVIRRCNILKGLHLGYSSGDLGELLSVDPKTVLNIGHAYLETGMDSALYDDERSGRPLDFDDRERSRIVAMVCTEPPKGN